MSPALVDFRIHHQTRWARVARPDPLSAGLLEGPPNARRAKLRTMSVALVNVTAGRRASVGFRPGASFANLKSDRVNLNGDLLEAAAHDPEQAEAFLAHAIHEGAHLRLTRAIELSEREKRRDGRILHWFHNLIDDERIEPAIARLYPPLGSALHAEQRTMNEQKPRRWGEMEALFALVRTPEALPDAVFHAHEKLLTGAIEVLTPFPEDPDGVERAARRLYALVPPEVREAWREIPWRLLPGGDHLEADGTRIRLRNPLRRMLEGLRRGEGGGMAGWPKLEFRIPRPDRQGYEGVRRAVARDAERVAGTLECMVPGRGSKRARSGRLDRRRLYSASYDDRVFRPIEMRSRTIDIALVIDLSASMRGESATLAQRLAITIAEAARIRRDVRLFVYGHTADHDGEPSTVIYRFATPARGRVDALGHLPVNGNNRDAHAYLEIADDLAEHATRRARARVALLIGDGAPSADDFHGEFAIESTREAIGELERRWGPVLVMATDHSPVLESLAPRPGAVVEPERAIEGLMRFLAAALGRSA